MRRVVFAAFLLSILGSEPSWAALTAASTFNPSDDVDLCGLGFDPDAEDVWIYGCSSADIQHYSATGTYLAEVVRPGVVANDVDLELTPRPLVLGATPVPGGSLLFIDGESGVAEIYAVNRTTGTVIATIATAFGVSHVVGGAYHPIRKTFFLIQDQVPSAADENRIAEIDPATGSVLNSFQITATFPVNFGDLDVCAASGNLIVASSDEARLAEYGPTGAFLQYHDLPAGVTSLSGIGIDDTTGDIWVANTVGNVWRLVGDACDPAPDVPALPGFAPLLLGVLLLGCGLVALAARE